MPLLVTLHVFSGRPAPQWILRDEEAARLRELIDSESKAGAPDAREGMLGYRGFSVHDTAAREGISPLFKAEGAEAGAASHRLAGLPQIEDFLLWTGHDHISDEVRAHVAGEFQRPKAELLADRPNIGCEPCRAADAPAYNPAFWNTPQRQPVNNCYNYANDQATNTFAQPGRAAGQMYTVLACTANPPQQGVRQAAQSDGLVACPDFSTPLQPGQGWYVALVIWPGNDYHWYRQDKVGCWSHKPGQTAARDVDNSNQKIRDPRGCNRGPYTVFCTFMITKRTVHIQ